MPAIPTLLSWLFPYKKKGLSVSTRSALSYYLFQNKISLLLINWLFQGMRSMGKADLIGKIVLEFILCLIFLLIIQGSISTRLVISIVAAHTVNWLINAHFWDLGRFLGLTRTPPHRFFPYIRRVEQRIRVNSSIGGVIVIGGVSRNAGFRETSDVDMIFIHERGFINAFKAVNDSCEGDFNEDGDVDGSDLAVFASDFGRTDCSSGDPCEGNFDNDNDVDGSDLAVFAQDFGRTECTLPPSGFSEDFEDDKADNWVDDGADVWSVGDGVYRMTGASTSNVRYSYYEENFDNFTYQVDIRRTQGSLLHAQGLVFRWGGTTQNGYAFHMGANGKYLIFKVADGIYTYLIPGWTESGAIHQGYDAWNTLKVVCSGSSMEFYINDTLVEALVDAEFSFGTVGVKALDGGGTTANIMEFDNATLTVDTTLSGAPPKAASSIPATFEAVEKSE